jgi:hypothetical protein
MSDDYLKIIPKDAHHVPPADRHANAFEWWYDLGERMEQDPAETNVTSIPCCSASVRLVDLEFDWPAGFARFELSIRNPNVVENLSTSTLAELEAILGCKLRQVRAHY